MEPAPPHQKHLIDSIIRALAQYGPMLGSELCRHHAGTNHLKMWQACFSASTIQISHFARYYLRYDVTREDMIRLSPSILRDFLSFTLFSLPGQRDAVLLRQIGLSNHHREISLQKIHIAQSLLIDILGQIPLSERAKMCAFIAGDLSYFLGHDEPRTVKQTGNIVNGSDIDIIILYDGLAPEYVDLIDREMMSAKGYYLRNPNERHEIDYICKPIERMFQQFAYSDIHEKIASKIVYESMFLAGSLEIYGRVKQELADSGAQAAIEDDFDSGLTQRKYAMKQLLKRDPENLDEDTESLFFFSQERIEFT